MEELIFKENMVHGAVHKNNLNSLSAPSFKGKSRAMSRSPTRARRRSPLAVRTNLMNFKKEAREKSPSAPLCSKPEAEANLTDDEGFDEYEFSLYCLELDEEDKFYDIVPLAQRPTQEELRDFIFGFHGKLNAFDDLECEPPSIDLMDLKEPEPEEIELDLQPVPLPELSLDWMDDDSCDDDSSDDDFSFNLSFD